MCLDFGTCGLTACVDVWCESIFCCKLASFCLYLGPVLRRPSPHPASVCCSPSSNLSLHFVYFLIKFRVPVSVTTEAIDVFTFCLVVLISLGFDQYKLENDNICRANMQLC